MDDVYIKLVKEGKKTVEQIPAKYREAVTAALEEIPVDDSGGA